MLRYSTKFNTNFSYIFMVHKYNNVAILKLHINEKLNEI